MKPKEYESFLFLKNYIESFYTKKKKLNFEKQSLIFYIQVCEEKKTLKHRESFQ